LASRFQPCQNQRVSKKGNQAIQKGGRRKRQALRIPKLDLILLAAITFGTGFVTAGLLFAFDVARQSLWEFRFIEVIEILVTFLVGSFIARFVSDRSSKEAKQRELYDQLLKDSVTHLEEIRSAVTDFVTDASPATRQYIITLFKTFANDLNALAEFAIRLDFAYDLHERFGPRLILLRAFGTGTVFDTEATEVERGHRLFEANIDAFQKMLRQLRFELYS
jgi:hypothetical protein